MLSLHQAIWLQEAPFWECIGVDGLWDLFQIDLFHFWHTMCPFQPTCHLGGNSKAECFGRPYSSLGGE